MFPNTYRSPIGHEVSDSTLPTLTSSLERIGSGISRKVYALDSRTVLKVCYEANTHAGNNLSEAAAYAALDPSDAHYFATVLAVADDGSWLVAERIETLAADTSNPSARDGVYEMFAVADEYGIGDLHEYNWGFRDDGSPCILDYALNENVGEYLSCGCGEHDCPECFPNGCSCGSLEGCHETLCDRCVRRPAERRIVTLFGFKRFYGSLVCPSCDPDYKPLLAPNEIRGQGAFIGPRFDSRGNLRELPYSSNNPHHVGYWS